MGFFEKKDDPRQRSILLSQNKRIFLVFPLGKEGFHVS
jgi:hypothetical protein